MGDAGTALFTKHEFSAGSRRPSSNQRAVSYGHITVPGFRPETELQKYYNDPDDKDATTWLCRAADAGNPEAQYRLGLLYEYGTGNFPKDPIKAYMWYRISESTGGYMRPADQAERILADIPPEQASKADQLVRDWKPGQCEKELTPSKADH